MIWIMQLFPEHSKNPEKDTYDVIEEKVIGLGCGCNIEDLSEEDRIKYYEFFNDPCNNIDLLETVIENNKELCGCAGGEKFKTVLRYFCKEMKIGDKVLIHRGEKPIALVEVISEPYTADKAWFRRNHSLVRNIKVLHKWTGNETWEVLEKFRMTLIKLNKQELKKRIFELIDKITEKAMANNLAQLLKHNKQIILYGPPGTGKTYRAKELAARILGLNPSSKEFEEKRFKPGNSPDGTWEIVQFHPSYNYEDFVRGISVTTTEDGQIKYEVKDRIFVEMCREAANNPEKPYILVIDEINRANLAAVLGELIYALEYRGEPVRLPYGVDFLKIPANLYIIGTMNTADRSIGHIDYAVRRRFAFVQVLPDKMVITKYYNEKNLEKVGKVAEKLFDEVEKLFKENGCLSPDYHREDVQPGHSYFLAETADKLAFKFAYQVWPLLKEYCKDGVLLCENENCEIKISDKSFSLKEEVKPEELIEAINSLTSEETKESENEGHKESQKETPPAS